MHFKNLQKNNFDRKANDLRWKILHRCLPSVARFLRDVGLRHIWQHRNSVVYNDQQPDTLCIFKAKVKQKVQTEFQIAKISGKLGKFQRDWTHHNLLTEIRNSFLVMNF